MFDYKSVKNCIVIDTLRHNVMNIVRILILDNFKVDWHLQKGRIFIFSTAYKDVVRSLEMSEIPYSYEVVS